MRSKIEYSLETSWSSHGSLSKLKLAYNAVAVRATGQQLVLDVNNMERLIDKSFIHALSGQGVRLV